MTRVIRIGAGEKVTILKSNFSSLVASYEFQAAAVDRQDVAGEIEIRGSKWIFRKPPVTEELRAVNRVHKGFWDTFFSISVVAHRELDVSLPGRDLKALRWIVWGGVVVLAVAAVILYVLAS